MQVPSDRSLPTMARTGAQPTCGRGLRRRQLPLHPAFLFLFLSSSFFWVKGVEGVGDGEGTPADVRMSGQDSRCRGGGLNGVYAYEGDTADGKRYYSHKTGENPAVVYLYFDADADNGENPDRCTRNNEWHIDTKPSTTAAQDLDGDSTCNTFAYSRLPDTSGSLTPPARAEWSVKCDGRKYPMTLSFQPICATTAPDWTYTYPAKWTAVNEGCGTGIAQQRTAAEACPARGGCDCQNKRATPPIETEKQIACTTTSSTTTSSTTAATATTTTPISTTTTATTTTTKATTTATTTTVTTTTATIQSKPDQPLIPDNQETKETKISPGLGAGIAVIALLIVAVIIISVILSRKRKQQGGAGAGGGGRARGNTGVQNINYALHGEGNVVVNQAYVDTLPRNRDRTDTAASTAALPPPQIQQQQHEQQQAQYEQVQSKEQSAVYSTVPSSAAVTAAKKGEIIYVSNGNNVYDKWGVGPTPVYSYSSKNSGVNAPATEYDAVSAQYADASLQQGRGGGPLPSHDNYSGYDISEPKPAIVYAVPMADDDVSNDNGNATYATPASEVADAPTYATAGAGSKGGKGGKGGLRAGGGSSRVRAGTVYAQPEGEQQQQQRSRKTTAYAPAMSGGRGRGRGGGGGRGSGGLRSSSGGSQQRSVQQAARAATATAAAATTRMHASASKQSGGGGKARGGKHQSSGVYGFAGNGGGGGGGGGGENYQAEEEV